jgi:hypothetical protein
MYFRLSHFLLDNCFLQSKPSACAKPLNAPVVATLPSLSKSTSHRADDEKHRQLAAMRAKTAATVLQKQQRTASVVASSAKKISNLQKGMSHRVTNTTKLAGNQLCSTETTAASILSKYLPEVLPPMDTYEISDKEDSDVESDSDDESQKSKKRIPTWALRENLNPHLDKQFAEGGLDPDEIFGEVETCDLQEIFDRKKTRYIKRTSSGNWCRDRATNEEKIAYKRTMQYSSVV